MQVPGQLHGALRAAALVTQMALQAVVGAWVGVILDGWSGTSPLLVLLLGGAGFLSGLLVTWRAFAAAQADEEKPPPTAPGRNPTDETSRNQEDSE